MKKIDLSLSVYDLTESYPELIEILKDLGFLGVTKPLVRKTLGRKMTIPEGCSLTTFKPVSGCSAGDDRFTVQALSSLSGILNRKIPAEGSQNCQRTA